MAINMFASLGHPTYLSHQVFHAHFPSQLAYQTYSSKFEK